MRQFNPKRVLRQLSRPLLRELCERQQPPPDVNWDDPEKSKVDDIFDAWQRLPDGPRRSIEVILQDVDDMATGDDGVRVLIEEGQRRCEDLRPVLAPMESRYDRALWSFLNRPDVWDAAVRFAKADSLTCGRFWIKRGDVPKVEPKTDDEGRRALAEAMSAFFREQGRGHNCRVDHFPRGNAHDYFFVYLSDYADTYVNFDEVGNFHRNTERRAFEVVFAYDQENGVLEMFAKGGKKVVEPLQELFCKVVLRRQLKAGVTGRAPYELDGLLDRDFRFDTDPEDCVVEVTVKSLRLAIIGSRRRRITLDADPERGKDCIHDMLDEDLNRRRLPRSVLHVRKSTIHFKLGGDGRGRSLTVNVSLPNHCDLKSKREGLRLLGEKYLRRWKIDVA